MAIARLLENLMRQRCKQKKQGIVLTREIIKKRNQENKEWQKRVDGARKKQKIEEVKDERYISKSCQTVIAK